MRIMLKLSVVLLICGCGAKGPSSPDDTVTAKKVATCKVELSGPREFFSQNFPNPFNMSTVIRLSLPRRSYVSLVIYSSSGRKVRTLLDGVLGAGIYEVRWDGTDDDGWQVASGVYFYRLEAGVYRKMTLVR